METVIPYVPLPHDQTSVRYAHGPDSIPVTGALRGRVSEIVLESSELYPRTSRRLWVHQPPGAAGTELGLLVVLDGALYRDPTGEVRAEIVLENLHHRHEIPPTLTVFLDPGVHADPAAPKQRNVEDDAADDTFVRFLAEEVLPAATANDPVSTNPGRRAICGGSSGGDAAFTAAWHRPDLFGNVIAFLPSFAQMPGGTPYPALLAAGERRPVRTFLQIGRRDLGWDQPAHNWFATNLRMVAALAATGHDVRAVLGDGGHSPNHGGVLFPDALRWAFGRG